MKQFISLFLFIIPIVSFTQIVEETILIDTITETIKVIYKPSVSSAYYTKKIAVFADDTTQIAIEKSTNKNGNSGLYKVFYPDGSLKVRTVYAKNKLNGEWTYYNNSGIIQIKGNYKLGVKHGYWAYKKLQTYGRYKDGLKFWRWYYKNKNNKRVKSTYKRGVLVRGKGYGNEKIAIPPKKVKSKKGKQQKEKDKTVSSEYEQAISFLKENVVFKKALKEHFAQNKLNEIRKLKKYFVRGKFQFVIAPLTMNLRLSSFATESENGKIVVPIIDSILKNNADVKTLFKNSKVEANEMLYNNSTKSSSTMAVYFSKVHQNLLRIDVVRYKEEVLESDFETRYYSSNSEQQFQLLLYINGEGMLKGAEYEKLQ